MFGKNFLIGYGFILLIVFLLAINWNTLFNNYSSGSSYTYQDSKTEVENNKLLYDSYSNYKKHENIEYAEKKDYKGRHHKLTLDLFEPEPADDLVKNRPVLLLAHGGGFFAGSKSDMTKFAEQFVKKGYVVISIDYRLRDNPVTNWSAAVDDAMDDLGNAFDWIIDHSEDYHIDPKRIAIGGESAGGELTLSFINAGPQIWQNRDKSRVFAVINLYGPMSKVNEIDSADPPILFIHGTEDRTISYNETVKMVDLHRSKGVYTELFTMEGEGHGTDKYWSDVVFEMTQFLHN